MGLSSWRVERGWGTGQIPPHQRRVVGVGSSAFRALGNELASVDYSRSGDQHVVAVAVSAQLGVRKRSGGAVLLTRAPEDRPKAAVLGATDLSRSSTTDLTALAFALSAPKRAEVAYEVVTSEVDTGRVLCRRSLAAERSSAAA